MLDKIWHFIYLTLTEWSLYSKLDIQVVNLYAENEITAFAI